MAWTWKSEPETPDAENPGEFSSQSDAESWLGEAWRTLAAAGVAGVSLQHDDEHVYGPMPLTE